MTTTTSKYLHIKTATASKTGQHAEGLITYAVLKDSASSNVFFCLLANESGGYFSREAVPFSAILQCISGVNADRPIAAKIFKPAFVGKSSNNSGFLVAALRKEGLLVAAPDASHQHYLGDDWENWKQAILAEEGLPYEWPESKVKVADIVTEIAPLKKASEGAKVKKSRKADIVKVEVTEPAEILDSADECSDVDTF